MRGRPRPSSLEKLYLLYTDDDSRQDDTTETGRCTMTAVGGYRLCEDKTSPLESGNHDVIVQFKSATEVTLPLSHAPAG